MNERGSIFLETIIATAIIAAMLAAAFDVLRDSSRRAQRVMRQEQAMLVAQSRLALYPLTRPVRPDRVGGQEPGFRWTVDVAPDRRGGVLDGLMLVRVRVVADDGSGASVALASLRPGAQTP